jgi:hypothetical protein
MAEQLTGLWGGIDAGSSPSPTLCTGPLTSPVPRPRCCCPYSPPAANRPSTFPAGRSAGCPGPTAVKPRPTRGMPK